MQNFFRLLRPALKHRWTLAGILLSSVMVGLLWGLNIGALFPVFKVAIQGRSLQEWVAEEISGAEKKVADLEDKLAIVDAESAEARKHKVSVENERTAIAFYQRLAPWIERLPRDPFNTVLFIVLALVAGTAFKGVFIFCNLMLVARLEQHVTFDLRQRFFHKCLKLDQASFGEERSSSLLSRFHADIGLVTGGMRVLAGTALREPLKIGACLVLASMISWRLLLLSMILSPITIYTIRRLAQSLKRANKRSLEEISSLYAVLTEAFQGIETIQAFTLERNQRQRFFGVAKACFRKSMRIAFYNALTKPVTELLGICVIALALISGAYLTLRQTAYLGPFRMLDRPLDPTSMMMFFAYLIGAVEPARKFSDVFNSIQAGTAASERLIPLLDHETDIEDPAEPAEVPNELQSLVVSNVGFHYTAENPVLIDVNLEIQAGESIAIVGPNGCGKTTLINMIPRFHDPVLGDVKLNGISLRDFRLRDLRRRIGMVTQRSILFDDTVYNNIKHGRLDATEQEIHAAAKSARADRFIHEKLSNGYETIIGPGGCNLSGGQRQRLALARAILRDPEILILDEATSQIDLESEQLIHQALEQFSKNRTVLMITHRLSTLELADRIVVMDQGRIIDVGTHHELIQRCALYQRLNEIQFKQAA